jgi:DNA modification methylase
MQLAWIQELHRVLKPKGILLISVHGQNSCKTMPKDIRYRLQSHGFVFVKLDATKGIFPNWYQLAFHTEDMSFKISANILRFSALWKEPSVVNRMQHYSRSSISINIRGTHSSIRKPLCYV